MTDNERRELWGEDKREAGKCGAPRSVAPCAALGVASLDTAMPVKVQEGNPVNPLTGQKYQVELDAAPLPGPLGLELKRHYNSALGIVKHPLGRAWTFSYDTRVFMTATTVQIVQADGHRLMFRRPDAGAPSKIRVSRKPGAGDVGQPAVASSNDRAPIVCASDLAENGSVLMLPEGGYEWRWPSGRRLRFNPQGYLIEIREPEAWHVLRVERDAQGRILRVTDPAGRQMRFAYDHRGHLSTIDHPRGQWRYQVSATGQLLSVTSPSRAQRFYRYEDPGFPSALTAIETGAPSLSQRLIQGRWRYDAQGRVIEYRGPAGDRRFRYLAPDAKGIATTEVSDSQGRQKIYRFREAFGQWQVLSVTGQDCAHCGPADRHFRYDAQGRLVGLRDQSDLDALSLARLYRVEHDPLGRVARIYLRTWATPSGEGSKPPSKGDETLTLFRRYEYADEQSRLPSLVARPSVLPGKEYTVAYEYRQIAGQQRPVRITERGYSHGTQVSRSARFVYDDTGRLIQMDGPLPGDADRIDFKSEKDETGQARVRMLTAWGDEVDLSMDGGWLRSSLNWLMDNGRFHAEAGALRHVAANGVSQKIHVDDFGRITRIESPDAGVETTYHDAADRVIRQTDSSGAELRIEYDERDRPLLKTLSAPDGKVVTTRYRYEGRHLVEVSNPVSTERYQYDERGRMVLREAIIHPKPDVPAQRFSTRFGYEGESDWPTRITLPNGAVIDRKLADNWHRVNLLNQSDAEVPVELYRRQLKATAIDEQLSQELWLFGNGLRRELAWAPQGRLLMLRDGRADEKTGDFEQIVTGGLLSYEPGGRINAISTPDGLRRFAYNRAGQLIIAESTSKPASASVPSSVPASALETAPAPVPALERTSVSVSAPSSSSQTISAGASSITAQSSAWWYAYDENGNRVFSGRHFSSRQSRGSVDALRRDSGGGTEGKEGASEHASRHAAPDERRSVAAVKNDDLGEVVRSNAGRVVTGTNRYEGVPYDAVGRPLSWQGWQVRWHAGGQIESLTDDQGRRIEYFYNHRGERVARLEHGEWRFYDYQDGRLQAERRLGVSVDTKGPSAIMRTWWYEGDIPVLAMTGEWRQPEQRNVLSRWLHRVWPLGGEQKKPNFALYWLHVDHHALPLAVTDMNGQPVWQHRFGPFGEPVSNAGSVDASGPAERHGNPASSGRLVKQARARANENDPMLRFPGQWVDETTGLYYNMMRDYDPWTGRYLSPDPLGPRAGPNPYLYVAGDPIRNIDPTGLLLFAFDGTYNAPDYPTNVWHFAQLYQEQGNGPNPLGTDHRSYLSGIGVMGGPDLPYERDKPLWRSAEEAYAAHYWRDNVEFHVQQFRDAVNLLKAGERLDVDVVGFSRGASQALEFGRLIARELRSGRFGDKAQQVNLRFMGLMDPVPTNIYGSHEIPKNFGRNEPTPRHLRELGESGRKAVDDWETLCQPMKVDDEWDSVINILAAHDRRNSLFKATSLGSQVKQSQTGMLREEFALIGAHSDIGGGYDDGDLSNVALWALIERAKAAGVHLNELPDGLSRVHRPIVHIEQWGPDLGKKDREFLVDGHWKRQGQSGVRGIDVSKEEVDWVDTERNEMGKVFDTLQPDSRKNDASDPGSGNKAVKPDTGLSRSKLRIGNESFGLHGAKPDPRSREIHSLAWRGKLIGTATINMDKYCRYLLRERFLSKCPY